MAACLCRVVGRYLGRWEVKSMDTTLPISILEPVWIHIMVESGTSTTHNVSPTYVHVC